MDWFEIEDPKKLYDNMQKIKTMLLNKKIPDIYPEDIAGHLPISYLGSDIYINRSEFIRISSFALISKSWLKPLAEYIGGGKCLEIMAGRGILSKGLNDFGIKIIATDDFSWKWNRGAGQARTKLEKNELWFDVEDLDCVEAVKKYGRDVDYIICCWPYMDNSIYKSLVKMRKINPECKLIYIGEGHGGCTADDDFHKAANLIEDDERFQQVSSKYQYWWGIHDRLCLVK